jgi:hypothetical protein
MLEKEKINYVSFKILKFKPYLISFENKIKTQKSELKNNRWSLFYLIRVCLDDERISARIAFFFVSG